MVTAAAPSYSNREPILWLSTTEAINEQYRKFVRVEGGEQIIERLPPRAHQGPHDAATFVPIRRWRRMVRHDGHVVASVFTSATAHLDDSTSQAKYTRAKWRFFGWYELGRCPVAMVLNNELRAEHLLAPSILEDRPCPPNECSERTPCRHALAELEARRARRTKHTAEVEARFQASERRMLDAQRENNEALISAITKAIEGKSAPAVDAAAIATIVATVMAQLRPPEPPPVPPQPIAPEPPPQPIAPEPPPAAQAPAPATAPMPEPKPPKGTR